MSASLTSIQGMPKLLVHGLHVEYQDCRRESIIQVSSTSIMKSTVSTGFQLQAQSKAEEAWKAHWQCQQEPI